MSSPYLWLRCGNKKCRRNLDPDCDTITSVPLGLGEEHVHDGGESERYRILQCRCGHVTAYGSALSEDRSARRTTR